jgi:hypothetical protein
MLRNHKKIIAVVVILVLIAAGVAAYFVFFNNKNKSQPAQKSNGPSSHKPIVKDPSEIKPGTKGPDIKSSTQLPASGPTSTPAAPKAAN